MTAQKRVRRQRKHDGLLSPDAVAAEAACSLAVCPFQRAADEADRTWGIDRLPELVTPDLARRYGAALGALNEAIRAADAPATAQNAANCVKGLRAMDAEARQLGHKPMPPELWEIELDGQKYGVIQDGADHVLIDRPDLKIITLREAVVAYAAYSKIAVVGKAKDLFPGAEITAIRERKPRTELEEELNDEIPF